MALVGVVFHFQRFPFSTTKHRKSWNVKIRYLGSQENTYWSYLRWTFHFLGIFFSANRQKKCWNIKKFSSSGPDREKPIIQLKQMGLLALLGVSFALSKVIFSRETNRKKIENRKINYHEEGLNWPDEIEGELLLFLFSFLSLPIEFRFLLNFWPSSSDAANFRSTGKKNNKNKNWI